MRRWKCPWPGNPDPPPSACDSSSKPERATGGSWRGDRRLGERARSSEKVTFHKSSTATCFCTRSLVSCRPHLLTLSNVSLKSSSALWLLEFLARKTSLWWAGMTLAWLWQNYQSVCQARIVSILESGWQTSTHAYQVLSVLCANISKQVFSYYWESAITSPVFTVFKAWCSGALTTNPLSFLQIKGIVKQVLKQENGEGDKTNFVLENRQTFPNN